MSTTNRPLYLPYAGSALLETPLLNKGSGFSTTERQSFNLTGLIPPMVESIQEQSERAYKQFSGFESAMDKHVYLRNIQDTNETLFYRLVDNHLEEMMPIIYTPTVGAACQQFSDIYRRARGLFISYPERENIDDILHNVNKQNVKVIVVTDGERILGLGDQGIGGMGIPIGKLSLYTSCGGISPANCLPIVLDVGTNNENRLQDPMYMGWRKPRIDQDKYNEFLDLFIDAVKRRWPNVLLQFEDFAQQNAMPLLERYKDKICCFNDDIQGTAAVTLGSLMAACRAAKTKLSEQKVTFLGAGSAGCGIAEQIVAQMKSEGLSDSQARARVFMVDRFGVLTDKMPNLLDFQQKLVQHQGLRDEWGIDSDVISLLDVMKHAKPSILIGVSGQPGLFTEQVIKTMAANTEHPIIFPLSNPTSRVEATPQDLIRWTEGRALVATGSPFPAVSYGDELITIPQCNNSYIFPGIGLGVLAAEATRVTNAMLMAASRALADCSPLGRDGQGPLLPPLTDIHAVSKEIAFWVAKTAQLQGVALQTSDEAIRNNIEKNFWLPEYREYKRVAN
ncbi:NAD-dependent malic enzyme [Moritella viscosa]|uniref:NAD-dependent malic enzyme n=1 Tax=Moritella viscosa TaxID=80854 RepID=A0A090IAP2_9GAMM|nr:NAD-dependent malic enzyme [Moritella viscosa]CED58846.1 NAD-dependent malic enzyme [Moritella viscosa]SGY83948.1 NAD-dependent malic enzyme [Moritella viscosa]SGY84601.1 NAD-dependent malic enzyme [Moritella viscosa]SGY84689.1 NAD-dependent malic enzyme [Moritella viscosa]SGY85508.1 NAD-dependent malic enzyme [Moritella viscosa]